MPNMMSQGSSGLLGARAGAQANVGGITGRAGGSFNVPRAQAAPGGYFAPAAAAGGNMAGAPAALVTLVLIEAVMLVLLRSAFKRHHGG